MHCLMAIIVYNPGLDSLQLAAAFTLRFFQRSAAQFRSGSQTAAAGDGWLSPALDFGLSSMPPAL